MRDFSKHHRWVSTNTATVLKSSGQVWPLDRIIDECARRGIRAVSPWRDQVARWLLKRRTGNCVTQAFNSQAIAVARCTIMEECPRFPIKYACSPRPHYTISYM